MDTLIFATQQNLRDLCRSANVPSSGSRHDLVNWLLHLNPQIPDRDIVTEFEDVADDEDEDDLVKTFTFSSSTQFLENTVRTTPRVVDVKQEHDSDDHSRFVRDVDSVVDPWSARTRRRSINGTGAYTQSPFSAAHDRPGPLRDPVPDSARPLQRAVDPTVSLLTQLVTQLTHSQLRQSAIPKVSLAKLGTGEDIEAFLTSFERSIVAYQVSSADWVCLLSPQLTGKALLANTELPLEEARDNGQVKVAIFHKYAITLEASRRRFRATKLEHEETASAFATRIHDTGNRWLQQAASRNAVVELVVLEQYTAALPSGVGSWLRERKPASLSDAARLTQDYWDTRCGKDALPPTHTAAVPKSRLPGSSQYSSHESSQTAYGPEPSPRPRNSGPPRCYSCGERGHIALRCPKARTPVMYADALLTDRADASGDQHESSESDLLGESYCCQPEQRAVASPRTTPDVVVTGVVNGYQVSNIVVDTACAQTMIHQDLVPDSKLVRQCVTIRCAHGDELQYPLADVEIEVGDYIYYVRADNRDNREQVGVWIKNRERTNTQAKTIDG